MADCAPVARVLYAAFDVVPSPKGASTHVLAFVAGLVAAGHEVVLATPLAPGLPARDVTAGAEHHRLGRGGSGNFLVRALAFGEAVDALARERGPFDVYHFRSLWPGVPLVLRGDAATVFEANSLASVEMPFHYPAVRGTPTVDKLARLERWLLGRSDAVVCVSAVSRAFLEVRGARPGRVHLIPNGVDAGLFAATPLPPRAGRDPVALYVGTLADWQGLGTLLEAMPAVRARVPLRLRVVGRGRQRQRKELLRRVRHLGLEGHVTLEPAVPHDAVPALIAQADVCVAPLSLDERNVVQGCCPLKVLEYASCGRPVVASGLPVVRELVRDGEALFVPPGAPDALAAALCRVLEDAGLADRLARRAAHRARHAFTWSRAQERLRALYAALLAARVPGTAPGSAAPPAPE
jgi:glycosyltransferase involved in cell wall biosynthesis